MAVPPTKDTIKSYFETGDVPTQAQFGELIDTSYNQTLNVVDMGADGTVGGNSAAFAEAFGAGNSIVYIPTGTYQVDGARINIASNTKIVCGPNVQVIKTADGSDEAWIDFRDTKENLIIEGNNSVWSYQTKPAADAQRHIFSLRGVSNVRLSNLKAERAGGDGFYVGPGVGLSYSQNVVLEQCVAEDCRRQGCSIVSGIDVWLKESAFNNTIGNLPEAGIDLEPDNNNHEMQNINVLNCSTNGNNGRGVMVYLNALAGAIDKNISINIVNHTDSNTGSAAGIGLSKLDLGVSNVMTGAINISNCTVFDSDVRGFQVQNWDARGPHVRIINPTVIRPNGNGSTDASLGAAIAVNAVAADTNTAPALGNVTIENPVVIDDRDIPLIKNYFYCRDVRTELPGSFQPLQNVNIVGPVTVSGVSVESDFIDYGATGAIDDPTRQFTDDRAVNRSIQGSTWNKYFSNTGATGTVVLTLGTQVSVAPGSPDLVFTVTEPQNMRIECSDGAILPGGELGKYIQSNVVGSTLKIRRQDANWYITSQTGSWTFEP